MAKLDDFLSKKKDTAPILDLSKATANNKEEFRRLFDKIPDYKIKQEKVRTEDVKIRDKNFKFKTGKKDYKRMKEPFTFLDPLPAEMKNLKVADFAAVPIDWRMLTTVRPKSKVEEEMFSKLVELGKAEIKTAARDKRIFAMDPQTRKSKNKAGVVEMRVVPCAECGEEFCNGKACTKFSYDSFARIPDMPSKTPIKSTTLEAGKEKKMKKKIKRSRSKQKSKRKSRSKSKSPTKDVAEK